MSTSTQIKLGTTKPEEIAWISNLEQGDAREFIIPYSIERHNDEFHKPGTIYKSVYANNQWVGFVILIPDSDGRSVVFRRIVIAQPGCGYGKQTLEVIDQICRDELNRNRIWLDVFETNIRARSLYEQCGYTQFGKSEYNGRNLLLFEKTFNTYSKINSWKKLQELAESFLKQKTRHN